MPDGGPETHRKTRILAGMRMVLAYLHAHPVEGQERELYAMNLRGDLTESERADLTALLLDTFPPDLAAELVTTWFQSVGMPMPQLTEDPTHDARFWASQANAKELSVYAAACFNRMSDKRKGEFAAWVQGKLNG